MLQRIVLVFLVLLFPSSTVPATELSISSFSFSSGVIHNIDASGTAFFPEIQAEGIFLHPSVHWGLAWGYSDDNNALPGQIMVGSSPLIYPYSYLDHIISGRIIFYPRRNPRNPATLAPFVGLSRHFLQAKTVDDGGIYRGIISRADYTTVDAGVTFTVRVHGPVAVRAEARALHPIHEETATYDLLRNRLAFTGGLTYVLK